MKNWQRYRLLGLFALLGAGYYFALPAKLFRDPASTLVESAGGRLLGAKIAADGQWRFPARKITSLKYAICLMAYEDKRFMHHRGVDFLATGRAFRHNLRQGKIVEGGSTISMQVIRLMRKGRPRTIREKMIECVLATRLEWRCSKREILELYMAHAPFGGNVVGIEAAAWRYFGRSPRHLSWAEAAMLAVLPNAPALIHPGRNRDALLKKRNALLDDLCRLRLLSEEDSRLAQLEPLPGEPFALPAIAPHLVERLAKTREGERTATTIDYFLQQHAVQVLNTHAEQLRGNSVNNAAAVIIDNRSGGVLAYVGNVTGRHHREYGEDVDLITSPRSTGSILKPFLYAGLIDEGDLLPNTLVPDVPTFLSGFAPQNFRKTFEGAVPVHEALERSLNVPWVRLLQDFGLARFYDLLKKMGITSLKYPSEHYGLSLILGGAEASLWDICAVYASMSRTLEHFSVYNSQYAAADWRKPLLTPPEHTPPPAVGEDCLISAAACWLVFDALSDVQRPEEEAEWKTFPSSRRVAWKTGTSYGNRDAWAVGVTPAYTIGVWVGNASGEGRPMLTGVGSAAPVLFDLFNLLPPTQWYAQPFDEMVRIAVCRESGHRATALCENADSMWVARSGLDTPPCPYHILVHLDRHGKYRVNADCEEAHRIISRPWFVLPPVQEYYYRTKHYAYAPLPPVDPRCTTVAQQRPMALIYPEHGLAVVPAKQLGGELGKIELQATHRRRSAIIYWHLDEEYLGATQYFHSMPVVPSAGQHAVTLVDDEGASLTSRFRVEEK
ncbi:MAG: penicillin-binding protein 1C [Prevotellaceae bacterium]|nr:penicillin-binding protein 1C [Prevotellaceae bacterium]